MCFTNMIWIIIIGEGFECPQKLLHYFGKSDKPMLKMFGNYDDNEAAVYCVARDYESTVLNNAFR